LHPCFSANTATTTYYHSHYYYHNCYYNFYCYYYYYYYYHCCYNCYYYFCYYSLYSDDCRVKLNNSQGIQKLTAELKATNHTLLVNVCGALWAASLNVEVKDVIAQHDGVSLLWSLLQCPSEKVVANAACALASTIDSPNNIRLVERAFMGGLPLIVSLLEQVTAIEAQASLCAVIGNLAKSTTVLAVMTEQRVLPILSRLTNTQHDTVRKYLAAFHLSVRP
jgi:hypothetical protein